MNKVSINFFVHVFSGYVFSFLLSKYQYWNFCILVLIDTEKQFSKVLGVIYNGTINVWEFQLLHFFDNTWYS